MPEIVFETDINGKITFTNQHGFKITGYTEEDLAKGFYAFSLIVPQDREKAFDYFRQIIYIAHSIF